MLVVADTSVLLNLCRVAHDHLLPGLFREVQIPPAVQLRVAFVGVAGILLRAKVAGLLPEVRPILLRLRTVASFWISARFEAEVLRIAGETP